MIVIVCQLLVHDFIKADVYFSVTGSVSVVSLNRQYDACKLSDIPFSFCKGLLFHITTCLFSQNFY